MKNNPIISTMLDRKSIRRYTSRKPSDATINLIVRAGQQAPFASQLCSVLVSKNRMRNPFKAPLLFTVCVDVHKLECIMAKRKWKIVTNDLSILLFGIQDASLMAENMVIAAESLGLGSCFLGNAPYTSSRIIRKYKLPKRVFPLVQLVIGYPAENPLPRPRYPIEFTLFEEEYPRFSNKMIERAMKVMDQGYLAQKYYRNLNAKIQIETKRTERFTYANYGWTEHISRKWGQWYPSSKPLINQLRMCGFDID